MWPMTATQRAQGQDLCSDNVDLVFVIENTAVLHSHFNNFKLNYLAKFLEWVATELAKLVITH